MAKTGRCDFSELKKFAEHLEKQEIKAKAMIERCINDLGAEVLARAKLRTPVDTGNLEKAWTISSIKRVGNYYKVIVSNNLEYAAYVEYGHRQEPGRYVPALGKRLKQSWVEGKYMLTISEKELESQLPAILEQKMKKYIEECLNNG